MNGADVGVVESGGGLGFAEETVFVFDKMGRKELQRDGAFEFRLFRLLHNAHPAFADVFQDAVVGYGLARHCCLISQILRCIKPAV